MQVFKLYMKILSRYWAFIALYVVIFMVISIANTESAQDNMVNFETTTVKSYIQDEDNSALSRGIIEFMKKNSELMEFEDDSEEAVKDAMFFRKVEYVLRIPKGFEENFLAGKTGDDLGLRSSTVQDSAAVPLLVTAVDKYINVTRMYFDAEKTIETSGVADVTLNEAKTSELLNIAITKASKVSEISTEVDIAEGKTATIPSYIYYFIYLAYPFISIFIMIIPWGMITVNDLNIKRRNLCSPISLTNMNVQLFSGNLVLAIGVYSAFWLLGLALYGSNMVSATGLLASVEALALTVLCLSLAFMVSSIFNDKGPIAALSTVFSLGICFLSGVFVDQDFLSDGLKNTMVVNPVFWYVKFMKELGATEAPRGQVMGTFWTSIGIQLAFAAAIFGVTLVITKQKRTAEGSGYSIQSSKV